MNENLRKQEKEFKANCRIQHNELKQKEKELAGLNEGINSEREELIEKTYNQELAKWQKLRKILGERMREIGELKHKIDDVPTRVELIQYERRFVELYEQVNTKLKEQKKHFNSFNISNSVLGILTKEVEFLQAVNKRMKKALKNESVMSKFITNFTKFKNDVKSKLENVENAHNIELSSYQELERKHKKLLEKQRAYFHIVHEFQEECALNEKYQNQIKSLK